MISMYEYVPVYAPSWEEFSNFSKYVEKIESEVGSTYGVCKVKPPKGWRPNNYNCTPSELLDNIDFTIPTAITQHTTGAKGTYLQMHEEFPEPITFKQFQSKIQPTPELDMYEYEYPTPSLEVNQLERKYWKNILFNPAIYGSDIAGSLFDSKVCKVWNMQNLNTCLQRRLMHNNICIPGVSTPFLYVGSYKSTFCWHTEDMDLSSINYLHCGAPKTWYGIPMAYKRKFEEFARSLYPEEFKNCPQALRHKTMLISPSVLAQNSIPVSRMTQNVGEFMITFPGSYHSGFNHGLNIAEATNFATKSWIEVGRNADRCLCQDATVSIDVNHLFADEQSLHVPEDEEIEFDYYERHRGDFRLSLDDCIRERVSIRIKLGDLPEGMHKTLFDGYFIPEAPTTPAVVEDTHPLSPPTEADVKPTESQETIQEEPKDEVMKEAQDQVLVIPKFETMVEQVVVECTTCSHPAPDVVQPATETTETTEKKKSTKRKKSETNKQPKKKRKVQQKEKPVPTKNSDYHHPLFKSFYKGSRF